MAWRGGYRGYPRKAKEGEAGFPERSSFTDFPFVLDTASKSAVLHIDATQQMRAGFRGAMEQSLAQGARVSPYLIFRVHRENIIQVRTSACADAAAEGARPGAVRRRGERGGGGAAPAIVPSGRRQLPPPPPPSGHCDTLTRARAPRTLCGRWRAWRATTSWTSRSH
jgi:hypothetical protein